MEQINVRSRFLVTLVVSALLLVIFLGQGIRLGQDLKGGTRLRFSLDLDRAEKTGRIEPGHREQVVDDTIKVIDQRINKFGLAETGITPVGDDKFEISLPADSEGDTDSIIDLVTALGDLKFRITVRPFDQYRRMDDNELPPRLRQPGDYPWAGSEGYEPTADGFNKFKEAEVARWNEAEATGTAYIPSDPRYFVVLKDEATTTEPKDFVVLEEPAQEIYRFDGRILKNPVKAVNPRTSMPVVNYEVKGDYQHVFGEWTEANRGLPMAIVLNERFFSDPVIQSKLTDNVQITLGGGKTFKEMDQEADQIATVLQTGSLKVRPQLESRNKTGARLAGESRDRGVLAVIVAFILVLLFMLYYYRLSGLVADLALLLNVLLLLGTLAFFKAVLTLPGIAGIVLTLGMAVDANILINERIREELLAGRSLRRAVTEGYNRAFTTIVDANVTSLITAIFLYVYGSGPVRGFAVTLAVGLVVSMFTAIYVTRTVFEWMLKHNTLKKWSMVGTGLPPKIPWVRLRRVFAPISVLGILFGLIVFASEDKYTFYDVDFTGGLKLQAQFKEPKTIDQVRKALSSGSKNLTVETEEYDKKGDLQTVEHAVVAGPYDNSDVVAVGTHGESVEITVQRGIQEEDAAGKIPSIEIQEKAFEGYVRDAFAKDLLPDWLATPLETYAAPEDADETMKAVDGGIHLAVNLIDQGDVLTPDGLQTAIKQDMPFWSVSAGQRKVLKASTVSRTVVVKPRETEDPTLKTYDLWMRSENKEGKQVEQSHDLVRTDLAKFLGGDGLRNSLVSQGVSKDAALDVSLSMPFPSVDVIGSSVAERLRNDALIALVLSLLGIIVYIALRFSSRSMGLSAVLCLFHDVAFTLGFVAVANVFGIVNAKISLPMVAAFLTLVGYSVNDTVVIFDRIRENRGKKRVITPAMIDLSINQTLSRTIKTSATFLLAAVALFVLNLGQRNVLEGFSFILILGSIIGTYSTIAIASPLLLFLPWLGVRIRAYRPRGAIVTRPAARWYALPILPLLALAWLLWTIAYGAGAFVVGLILFPVWTMVEKVGDERETVEEGSAIPA